MDKVRVIRGKLKDWISKNPVLRPGEIGIVYDDITLLPLGLKAGNGFTTFTEMPFLGKQGSGDSEVNWDVLGDNKSFIKNLGLNEEGRVILTYQDLESGAFSEKDVTDLFYNKEAIQGLGFILGDDLQDLELAVSEIRRVIPSEASAENPVTTKSQVLQLINYPEETDPTIADWAKQPEKPTYTKEEVGLGNVDNTSDADKPVSNATRNALAEKVDKEDGKQLTEVNFSEIMRKELQEDIPEEIRLIKEKIPTIEESLKSKQPKTDSGLLTKSKEIVGAINEVYQKASSGGGSSGGEIVGDYVSSINGVSGEITLDKSWVGLGEVDNTSDEDKPVSIATQQALGGKVDKVPGKGLSSEDYTAIEKMKLASIETGAEANSVLSVAGKIGKVELESGDVGLGNVDNTSDANKPISTAQQTEFDKKLNKVNSVGEEKVYAVDTNGNQEMLVADEGKKAGSLAKRNSNGQILVATPTESDHATPKGYVDSNDKKLQDKIDELKGITDELPDKQFVLDSVKNLTAHRVCSTAAGAGFATKAALLSATTFYYKGEPHVLDEHDYALVERDETAPEPFTGGQTRYEYDGSQWVYAYGYDNRPLTPEEKAALASGVTETVVGKANSAYQKPSDGIPKEDLSQGVVSSLEKADSALQSETDPTVPAWAKEASKPSYTYSEIGGLVDKLDGKVDKEEGKGLSSEDYTSAEKKKLSGVEEKAQANIIEAIAVNGVVQEIKEGKEVQITVPTKPSDIGAQAELQSGFNIKTINGQSLVGSGDLEVAKADTVVDLESDQQIGGTKTFLESIKVPQKETTPSITKTTEVATEAQVAKTKVALEEGIQELSGNLQTEIGNREEAIGDLDSKKLDKTGGEVSGDLIFVGVTSGEGFGVKYTCGDCGYYVKDYLLYNPPESEQSHKHVHSVWKIADEGGNPQFIRNYIEHYLETGETWITGLREFVDGEAIRAFSTKNKPTVEQVDGLQVKFDEFTLLLNELKSSLNGLENLGQFVGSFETVGDLPDTIDEFTDIVPTINDFATVRNDTVKNGRTCYTIKNIEDGAITWEYEYTYSEDNSGKMDKVPGATDFVAIFDTNGNVKKIQGITVSKIQELIDKEHEEVTDSHIKTVKVFESEKSDQAKALITQGGALVNKGDETTPVYVKDGEVLEGNPLGGMAYLEKPDGEGYLQLGKNGALTANTSINQTSSPNRDGLLSKADHAKLNCPKIFLIAPSGQTLSPSDLEISLAGGIDLPPEESLVQAYTITQKLWSGSNGNYSVVLPMGEHGKGGSAISGLYLPKVRTFLLGQENSDGTFNNAKTSKVLTETFDSSVIDFKTGDVTITSNFAAYLLVQIS